MSEFDVGMIYYKNVGNAKQQINLSTYVQEGAIKIKTAPHFI